MSVIPRPLRGRGRPAPSLGPPRSSSRRCSSRAARRCSASRPAAADPGSRYRPPGRRPGQRPVPAADDAVRPRQPRARVRHRSRAPSCGQPPTARSPSPARWPGPATSPSSTSTACGPRRRASPRSTSSWASGSARATGSAPPRASSTSAPGPATRTSIRRRCSSRVLPTCGWSRSTNLPVAGIGGERSAIRQLLGLGAAAVGWAGDAGGELVRTALALRPGRDRSLAGGDADSAGRRRASQRRLGPGDTARAPPTGWTSHPPAERRVAILVAGLGSTSTSGSIDDLDTTGLGYEPDDVRPVQLRGWANTRVLRSPGRRSGPALRRRRHAAGPAHQRGSAGRPGRSRGRDGTRGADRPARPLPGRTRVPAGHRRARAPRVSRRPGDAGHHGDPARGRRPRHDGADRRSDPDRRGRRGPGGRPVRPRRRPSRRSPSSARHPTWSATSPGPRCPEDLEAVSIAGRADFVVPVPRTRLDGAREVVVSVDGSANAHKDLPGDPATARELALALAGAPPGAAGSSTRSPTRPSGPG